MRFVALLLGAFSLVQHFLDVNWSTTAKDSVTIRVPGLAEPVSECLSAGKQARVRFEVRLCRRRSAWLDHCQSPRSEMHTVEFDAITESYRVVSDRFGDTEDPTAVGIPGRDQAVEEMLVSHRVAIPFLERDEEGLSRDPRAYISVRTIFRCVGSSSRTFAHLSRFLTFGLVNVVESVSDWHDFSLEPGGDGEGIAGQEEGR